MAETSDNERYDEPDRQPTLTDPPYQALFPRLDRVSRESFRAGTVSRRRIVRASAFLGVVLVIVIALVVFADSLFGVGGPLR
ncbi:hypothetical protein L1277_000177 [Okibacterium sp. HSC-33S16]|uniref:hypothetical protein n=1 Tax=Okibacterium sp. HSC-33S16 TaxID=2910965 RepID=UPI00209D4B4F|nr:hypothetical protein [Okibacterium sp. HSC-33S16]MCP2030113.1 hypothetical protein [Okibacterium sp. HSC-33S16]